MNRDRLAYGLAFAACLFAMPTLADNLFLITSIVDDLNFVFTRLLLLSIFLSMASLGLLLSYRIKTNAPGPSITATVALSLAPFIVFGMGFLPIAGMLRFR